MKTRILLSIGLLLVSFHFTAAQDTLGIGPTVITGWQDTVCNGQQVTFQVEIENKGGTTFTGKTLFLNLQVNGDTSMIDTSSVDTTIFPGNSVLLSFTEVFDTVSQPAYLIGGNTVVIWPSALNTVILDSASKNVFIQICTGYQEDEWPDAKRVFVYPNPANSSLIIKNTGGFGLPEQVRIMDVTGRQVKVVYGQGIIDLSGIANGTYFVEVDYGENRKKIVKVIKSE